MEKFKGLSSNDTIEVVNYLLYNCSKQLIEDDILEYDWDEDGMNLLFDEVEEIIDYLKDITHKSL